MISVCIATFNGSSFIKEQLLSIVSQLSAEDEVIVSDDHSTDDTVNIIESLNDSRIKVYKNSHAKGYTGNFENALSLASGDIIFLADQDDVWFSNKVETCLNELKTSDFVITDARVVNSNLELLAQSYFELRNTTFGLFNSLIRCRYLGCCYVFKRRVLKKSLPFPSKHNFLPHDLWLALVGETFFSVVYLKEPLVLYRRHSKNISDGGEQSSNNLFVKIKIRIYSVLNIFRILFK